MAKHHSRSRRPPIQKYVKPGAPPGTLISDPRFPAPIIHVMNYNPDSFEAHEYSDVREIAQRWGDWEQQWTVTWVHVEGLGNADVVADLGEAFHLHRLALEDVLNVQQRPKVDRYPDFLFIVARMVERVEKVTTEQLCIFLGHKYVISFEERPNSILGVLRDRLRENKGVLRQRGPDMLAYALLDIALDSYFPVLEEFDEALETLEDDVIRRPTNENLVSIYEFKRNLLRLRHDVWPQRDAINSLFHQSLELLTDEARMYLRDCYDHAVQIYDLLEHYRDMASGLIDIHLSSINNRMNDVMRVLTIIATLFMPLGFLASLYGMNFDGHVSPFNMPELHWYFGYPFALSLMILTATSMLWFFRSKGWIGHRAESGEMKTAINKQLPPDSSAPKQD